MSTIKSGISQFPVLRESFYCIILVEQGHTVLKVNGAELYRHHDVEYYADRLCITPNYLNKVSHASLGVGARKYIQSRIIAEAMTLPCLHFSFMPRPTSAI